MDKILALLFSPSGRITRSQWWLGGLLGVVGLVLLWLLSLLIMIPLGISSPLESEEIGTIGFVLTVIYVSIGSILIAWIGIILNIKRLHDFSMKGWWQLLFYIPYVGVLGMLVWMGCMRGEAKDNPYGKNPYAASKS